MALIKFGSVITDSRGSIGGHTIQWSRAGHKLGARGMTRKSATGKQSVVRASFAGLTKRWWSVLDSTQRTDWRDLAAANPLPNRWGDEYPLTGLAFYVRVNQRLLQATGAATDDAPADQTVTNLTSLSMSCTAPDVATVSFAPGTVPANHCVVLFTTPQLSPGINAVVGKLNWLMMLPESTSSPQDISTELISQIGALESGRAVWLQGALLNTDNGARSPLLTSQTIVG